MENVELFETAIAWAKKKGIKSIKANTENYDTPSKFTRKGDDEDDVIPDITGVQSTNKCYVEIAQKADDVQRIVSKWKLLSRMAEIKGGRLYLLAPRGSKAFTEKIVEQHNLKARVESL